MGPPDEDATTKLAALIGGFRASQALYAAATLGVADLLAQGPRSSDDVALATGSHPDALYRLLRALASIDILHEDDNRTFSLTPVGDGLRTDAPDSLAGRAAYIGRSYYWDAWGQLLHSVRTGENAFRALHGSDVWEYRAAHPEESALFDRAMTSRVRLAQDALLDAYDFSGFATIVDVGGGQGALLAALLDRHQAMQGVLFDQPHVVTGADEVLRAAGVADRCRIVGGSFFSAVPEGGDAYLLKSIIHDWEDEEALEILRICRAAVPPHGALLLVERTLGKPNEDAETKFSDLNMLVAPGGRERTLDEFAALFEAAGFRLEGESATAAGESVIAAAPA